MRIVVQRTFLEVVEESSSQLLEGAVRRALSAPAAPSRRSEASSGEEEEEEEEEAKGLDGPLDVAQQAPGAEGQRGHEPKTTVAIRNIPLHFTRDQVQQHLDAGASSAGQYDFLYLPINFAKRCNFGYCFVNLTASEHAQGVLAEFDGIGWGHPGEGNAVVSWSLTQGMDSHVERYRNSPVMHESVPDECKPIVLEGGVRVDFPPPTRKVQRLRRLRTRCGSRGRGVPPSGGMHGMEAQLVGDVLGAPAGSCTLLSGLSSAPSGAHGQAGAIMASPLLAGLTRAGAEGPPAAPGPKAGAPPRRRAAWADLQVDPDDGFSECSTQAAGCSSDCPLVPGCSSGVPSSDGSSGGLSDGQAAGSRRGSGGSARPWCGSMLAKGLMPTLLEERDVRSLLGSVVEVVGSLIEIVGAFPSGAHAVITDVDRGKGTFDVQVIQNGRRARRLRTIKWKHARFLRHAEVFRP